MNQKKRGLGRGLGELGLSELLNDFHTTVMLEPTVGTEKAANEQLCYLNVKQIQPGQYQPRKSISEQGLQELAESIQAQGIIQPIIVRQQENHYEIIAGERRWRAAQLAGLQQVPAIIRSISNESALAISLIENIQRQDLNAIEEAEALNRLISEFALSHQEVAQAVGRSRSFISNILRLLKLDQTVQNLLQEGHIEMGHARALLSLPQSQQIQIANMIVARDLSVRETENLVRKLLEENSPLSSGQQEIRKNPDILHLQNQLSEKLGAAILIHANTSGKGKLIIHFNSADELDGILQHIQ